ncbi:hypothetical protein LTR95_006560 [Oleoguttula sp. CCFEE 5521]
MTRALIFGLGGVGCIYGYIVEQGGVEVIAVCRSNYEQVKSNGVVIRSAKWGTVTARPHAARSPQEAAQYGPFDYILICSKAFPGTSELIRDAVTEGTAIVLAQNGIGIETEYTTAYPSNTIISGVVYLPTTQVEPGVVEHGTPLERFEIGTYPSDAGSAAEDAVTKLAALFTKGGGTCIAYDDVQAQRWEKLSVNASLNPITALSLCDDANFLRSSPGALEVAKDVMREVGAVAAAYGYHGVDKATIDRHMLRHEQRVNGKEPSMLVDVRQNRPVEVEAILGNTVRLAEDKHVAVPYLRMLYTLTKARNFAILQTDEWKPIARVS